MPNVLNVSLDTSTDPWTVNVDQSGNANHVSQSPNAQTITWQLTGNAATGDIVSFTWLGTPPSAGIFGTPTISSNGNQMTMTDSNTGTTTAGTWTYQLKIKVGGTEYSTLATSIRATNSNPTIKNN